MTTSSLALTGSLDMAHARELHGIALATARDADDDVSFDCRNVERIDAAGVQVLLALSRALEARGLGLQLVGLPDRVRALLRTTGLAELLRMADLAPEAASDDDQEDKEEVERA